MYENLEAGMQRAQQVETPTYTSGRTFGPGREVSGLEFERYFAKDGDPFDEIDWELRSALIANERGELVFEQRDVEFPRFWSQQATNIVVSKYFRGQIGSPERERSVKQLIGRVVTTITGWAREQQYFASEDDLQAFSDDLKHLLVYQKGSFNSPVWFNCGFEKAPQCSACFINAVQDTMDSILRLARTEGMLFKFGSGTGSNLSPIRSSKEVLAGGGTASGPVSFMKGFDAFAGVIKSGGKTRRAAKMVILNAEHPDIVEFINCKVEEEKKAWALIDAGYDGSFTGPAYASVFFQNSNNSVRVTDEFMRAVLDDGEWQTRSVTNGQVVDTYKARDLMRQIAEATWVCGDPGMQYDTTVNDWHTCPNTARINASNPCSEYMFLDNTACNLASINLITLYDVKTRTFDVAAYEHAIDLWTMVLEISVLMAAFPSREIAHLSWKYRTLGLGYANLGAMLMQAGLAYDSDEARALTGCLTSILTGRSYRMSALLAKEHGAFAGFADDREAMLRVIRNHRLAAHGEARTSAKYENLKIRPVPIDHKLCRSGKLLVTNAGELLEHATESWDEALELGIQYGYRNAQVTVIAPTGTIGLLMDCDTTGIEPDFALVKFKKLAGGGYFKIANASVRPALEALGYADKQIRDMMIYLLGSLSVDVPLPGAGKTFKQFLLEKGFAESDLTKVNDALPGVFELSFAFSAWGLGDDVLKRLGVDPAAAKADPTFNLLRKLGLTAQQVEQLNDIICGVQTIEGAPHLRPEHLSVFDCASKCGRIGQRFIAPNGHIWMMAAAQQFISGAISKTINLPNDAGVADIKAAYRLSWELGLKANALYRDGCKLSQPLSTKSDKEEAKDEGKSVASAGAKAAANDAAELAHEVAQQIAHEVTREVVRVENRPMRRRLPDTRASITHKFNIAGNEGYLTVGLYEDGLPGELFITMAKEGSTIGGLMDVLGTAISIGLQYGVPLEVFVNKFAHSRFEPAGFTKNPDIPIAKSVADYIFRWLGMQFIKGYREANAPQRFVEEKAPAPIAAPAATPSALSNAGAEATPAPAVVKINGHRSATAADLDLAEQAAHVQHDRNEQFARFQSDAPTCDNCGALTVRCGTCYRCFNCGNSMGCG